MRFGLTVCSNLECLQARINIAENGRMMAESGFCQKKKKTNDRLKWHSSLSLQLITFTEPLNSVSH